MELRAGVTLRKEKPSCQLQEQVTGVTVSVADQSLAGAKPASAASARAECTSLGGGSAGASVAHKSSFTIYRNRL